MKAKRLNLIQPVRQALSESGMSTVRLVAAVNAALGELASQESESKLGDGKVAVKGTMFKVTETTTDKYEGKLTAPLLFDAWHSALAKAHKICAFENVGLPPTMAEWLGKFIAKTEDEKKALKKEMEEAV